MILIPPALAPGSSEGVDGGGCEDDPLGMDCVEEGKEGVDAVPALEEERVASCAEMRLRKRVEWVTR